MAGKGMSAMLAAAFMALMLSAGSMSALATETEKSNTTTEKSNTTTEKNNNTQTETKTDEKKTETVKPSLSAKKLKVISSEKKELVLKDTKLAPAWKSSNKKVAVVQKTKDPYKVKIKGKKAGKATISVKVGKTTLKCKVTVKYRPKISLQKKTLKGNKTVTLTVTGTTSKPRWSSSAPEIADFKKKSARKVTVYGVQNGKAWIYARVNNKTLKCRIKVKGKKRVTNCIMGSKSSGYYYVDGGGNRVNDPQIVTALAFLNSVSKSSQSPRTRLRKCFEKLCTYTYSWHPDYPSAAVMPKYAADTFRTKIANCWRFGAALAYIARVLGYESRVCIGGVTAYQNHALDNHGWCEVYIDGTWKMIDVSMQMAHPEVSLFLVPRSKYPFRLRCDSVYTLTVNNGKVNWG